MTVDSNFVNSYNCVFCIVTWYSLCIYLIKMSLAEICGMQDFDSHTSHNLYENDVSKLCMNFTNNLELGVPPFSNVSFNHFFTEKRI